MRHVARKLAPEPGFRRQGLDGSRSAIAQPFPKPAPPRSAMDKAKEAMVDSKASGRGKRPSRTGLAGQQDSVGH